MPGLIPVLLARVLRTDATTVAVSSGEMARRSTTSIDRPSAAAAAATLSAVGTVGPYATSVRSVPSRTTTAELRVESPTGASSTTSPLSQ